MERMINQSKIKLLDGDITRQDTEAIVNAANSGLRGGGGVDGAIHKAGGPAIMEACRRIGGCPTGEARLTLGGRLSAKYVIHAVGPVYKDGQQGEPSQLASAYRYSLVLASKHGIKAVAFPSISTGVYGYPIKAAAQIAIETVIDYLKSNQGINEVRFVLFGAGPYRIYKEVLEDRIRIARND